MKIRFLYYSDGYKDQSHMDWHFEAVPQVGDTVSLAPLRLAEEKPRTVQAVHWIALYDPDNIDVEIELS